MKTILVCGGNSGIGLQAAREFLSKGHRVVLLGRDEMKGEEALASFGEMRERASFISVDLSTHDGVREAAKRVLEKHDKLDAVLHSAGFLTFKEMRTKDGLHPYFAVNYLSRYHLTQLLLPALRRAERAHVVMMTSDVPVSTKVDLKQFPKFEPLSWLAMGKPIQIANHHYAAHLTRNEPGFMVGVVNAGAAKTDIMRAMPWYFKAVATIVGPFLFNSIEQSTHNAVEACLSDDWTTPMYWGTPGKFDQGTPIVLDESVTREIISVSQAITGA